MSVRKKQSGATLIESLVSLVILAIAVIGMLGVQVRTLMETNTAASRAQAMRLIEDLSERVKANPGKFDTLGRYITGYPLSNPVISPSPMGTDCAAVACTDDQLADYDMHRWTTHAFQVLPGASVQTFLSSGDDAATGQRQLGILIAWSQKERAGAMMADPFKTQSGVLSTGVMCPTHLICHLAYIQP